VAHDPRPLGGGALVRQGAVGLFHGRAGRVAAHQLVVVGSLEEGELGDGGVAATTLLLDLEVFRTDSGEDTGARVHLLALAADIALPVNDRDALLSPTVPLAI